MASRPVSTTIHLPPGQLPDKVVRELLRLAFKEYRWFLPALTSCFGEAARVRGERLDDGALLAHYDEYGSISIMDRMDRDFMALHSSRNPEFPFVGRITWAISVDETSDAALLDAHLQQVVELMRLTGALLAQSGFTEDFGRKTRRLVPLEDGGGLEQVITVRDPSEGLAGLYWRNFFGPPFVRMFGDRLLSLPPGTVQHLGDGLVLVQPYALPTQAMTPEGDSAEERLITVLGPECFYDFQHHRKPTRLPDLSPP